MFEVVLAAIEWFVMSGDFHWWVLDSCGNCLWSFRVLVCFVIFALVFGFWFGYRHVFWGSILIEFVAGVMCLLGCEFLVCLFATKGVVVWVAALFSLRARGVHRFDRLLWIYGF